jgi:hypothetical protein
MVDYVNVTLNKKTFTAVVDALRPSTSRGTQRMACDTALSDQFDPFRAQVIGLLRIIFVL